MGISGLATFVKKVDPERRAWTYQEVRGPLVIDGSQFCYQFYKSGNLDVINGGQYPEFRQKVGNFFTQLRQSGIESHVVFEGIDKSQKLTDEYLLKRSRKRYLRTQRQLINCPSESTEMTTLPQLAYTILCNVLSDMGVHTYVADGEGDEACVKIAKHLGCPVLSNDSDFYLFDIPGGYIQLAPAAGHIEFARNPNGLRAVAQVYHREDFFALSLTNGSFHERDMWYFFPAILGNGVFPDDMRRHFVSEIGQQQQLEWIRSCLSQKKSVHNYLQSVPDASIREDLRQRFEDVRAYYNPCQQNPEDLLMEPIALRPQLPQWFLIEHRKHAIPYMLVDALVNGKQHHSGSCVSLHIRQCCYKILGVEKVKEYHMNADEAAIISIKCTDLQLLHFSEVPQASPNERQSLLFSIHGCTRAQLETLEEAEKLFACTIVFWSSHARPNPPLYLFKALLACFVLCSTNPGTLQAIRAHICRDISQEYMVPHLLRDRQLLIDWQCVYKDAVALRILLQCSPEIEACPSRIYDGKIVMSLASRMNEIDTVIPRLGISMEKYDKLLQIVLPRQ